LIDVLLIIKIYQIMKRKVLLSIGVMVVFTIVALSVNVSIYRNGNTGNIDLAQLKVMSSADAECYNDPPELNNGRCFTMTGRCHELETPYDCDPSRGR
jgi:hypothetical protein